MIKVADLWFRFGRRELLRGVSFSVAAGESVAVTGQTGSGKSTLLAVLTGLVRVTSGVVNVGGVDLRRASRRELTALRRATIGMVHQHGELIPNLNAVENVMLPMMLQPRCSWQTARERAKSLCARFELESLDVPAESLSGGERQRVGLARALANDPVVLLADEPTASLDRATRDAVAEAIRAVARSGAAVLVVTHDETVAGLADRRLELTDGELRPHAA